MVNFPPLGFLRCLGSILIPVLQQTSGAICPGVGCLGSSSFFPAGLHILPFDVPDDILTDLPGDLVSTLLPILLQVQQIWVMEDDLNLFFVRLGGLDCWGLEGEEAIGVEIIGAFELSFVRLFRTVHIEFKAIG